MWTLPHSYSNSWSYNTHARARAYWTQKLNMILWMNQTTIVYRRKRMFRRRYRWYIILETTSVCATKERLIIETQGSNQSSLYSTQSLRCVNETNVCRYNVQDFESFTYNIHLKKRWEHDDAIVQFVLFSHNKVVGSNLAYQLVWCFVFNLIIYSLSLCVILCNSGLRSCIQFANCPCPMAELNE